MITFLKNIPVPIVGLFLGVAALANLHLTMGLNILGNIFLMIACILLIISILKIVLSPQNIWMHLQNPIIASVFPAIFMGTLILCTIFEWPIIWWGVAILQCLYVIAFTYKYVWKAKATINHVFPSWFIVYVGLGMIPITAGDFSNTFATVLWLLACVGLIIVFPIVCIRVFKRKNIPDPAKPLITILAAPFSICMTGYINHFHHISEFPVYCFELIAQIMYIIVLLKLLRLLKLPFYPSYAAFTFPLVASAISLNAVFTTFSSLSFVQFIVYFEVLIATLMVVYVLIRYTMYVKKVS